MTNPLGNVKQNIFTLWVTSTIDFTSHLQYKLSGRQKIHMRMVLESLRCSGFKIKIWIEIYLKFELRYICRPFGASTFFVLPIFWAMISETWNDYAVNTPQHVQKLQQCRSKLDNWGGGGLIFIYSCSALLISFEIHTGITSTRKSQ